MFGIIDGERYLLKIHLIRPGCPQETLHHYYVVSTMPAGGFRVRVQSPDEFILDETDTLMFEFTPEPYEPERTD